MIQDGYHKDIQTVSNYSFFLKRYERMSQEVGIFCIELFPMFSFLGVNSNEYLGCRQFSCNQGKVTDLLGLLLEKKTSTSPTIH